MHLMERTNMNVQIPQSVSRVANWIGIAATFIPIPFAIKDAMQFRLWEVPSWSIWTIAVGFTVACSLAAYWNARGLVLLTYWIARGLGWLTRRMFLRRS